MTILINRRLLIKKTPLPLELAACLFHQHFWVFDCCSKRFILTHISINTPAIWSGLPGAAVTEKQTFKTSCAVFAPTFDISENGRLAHAYQCHYS